MVAFSKELGSVRSEDSGEKKREGRKKKTKAGAGSREEVACCSNDQKTTCKARRGTARTVISGRADGGTVYSIPTVPGPRGEILMWEQTNGNWSPPGRGAAASWGVYTAGRQVPSPPSTEVRFLPSPCPASTQSCPACGGEPGSGPIPANSPWRAARIPRRWGSAGPAAPPIASHGPDFPSFCPLPPTNERRKCHPHHAGPENKKKRETGVRCDDGAGHSPRSSLHTCLPSTGASQPYRTPDIQPTYLHVLVHTDAHPQLQRRQQQQQQAAPHVVRRSAVRPGTEKNTVVVQSGDPGPVSSAASVSVPVSRSLG